MFRPSSLNTVNTGEPCLLRFICKIHECDGECQIKKGKKETCSYIELHHLGFLILLENERLLLYPKLLFSNNYMPNFTSGNMFYASKTGSGCFAIALPLFSQTFCFTLLNCQFEQGRASTCGITHCL